MTEIQTSEIEQPLAHPDPEMPEAARPSAAGMWLATVALFTTYLFAQLVIVIPVIAWWIASDSLQNTDAVEALLYSERGLWLTLIAAGLSALLTILVALIWPRVWRSLSSRSKFSFADWFGWVAPRHLPMWSIPLGTIALAILGSSIVASLSGTPEVAAQLALFSTPSLQIGATLIVSSMVPMAEELIFRGAMYNALETRKAGSVWQRHGLAVVVTSLSFAAVHLLAGFETLASLLLIGLFAFALGLLRAFTGSVQATMISHAVWNIIGSLALVAANNLPT